MRSSLWGWALGIWVTGCATPAEPAPAPTPTAAPTAVVNDATDAALVASGFETPAQLNKARQNFEQLVGPIVAQLAAVPDETERARLLLTALHQKGGPFGEYDARATTLAEILERRRYNCVSASVVYNVLAERLKLNVAAQLLPTHARSLLSVVAGGALRRVVVETTSSSGFDPDAQQEARILENVAGPMIDGARALVSDKGAVVGTPVLIGTMYVNRASIAQEAGELERAERLFERGEATASDEEMRRILRDQRAALLSQLAADDVGSEDPERIPRAYRTLKAAAALDPQHPRIRSAVFQNLRAAAERLINREAQRGDEQALLSLAGDAAASGMAPTDRLGLRAFALSEVARLRISAQKFELAVEAIELALKEQLGPGDAGLKQTLEQNRISALRLAAFSYAKRGDYTQSLGFVERLEGLPGVDAQATRDDRLRVIHLVGNQRIDAHDFGGAAEVYRDAVRRFPGDTTARHNLVAVLEQLAVPLVQQVRCEEARPFLEEILVLDAKAAFPIKAQVRCFLERAKVRLEGGDFAEAVSLIRAADKLSPGEPTIRQNLGVSLLRWAKAQAQEGRCAEANKLGKEVRALGLKDFGAAEVGAALGNCRG
ncbi:MAG: hypothetical protein IPG45_34110 [Deltaproteobacteria bacterium]|nr:hypothetical protein [Deltaproteobacteria bacterium]